MKCKTIQLRDGGFKILLQKENNGKNKKSDFLLSDSLHYQKIIVC